MESLKSVSESMAPYLKDERVLVGLAIATVVGGLSLKALRRKRRPPGPRVWPVVGSLPSLGEELWVFKKMAEEYGDIYYLEMGLFGQNPTIVISSMELVREALVRKQDDFAGRSRTPVFDMISDNGSSIVFGDFHEVWRYQRKIAHVALRKYASGVQFQNLLERNVEMISEVFKQSSGKPVDIFKPSSLIFYNIIASLCFGKNYTMDDPEFNRVRGLIDEANDLFSGFFLSDLLPILRFIPTKSMALVKSTVRAIFQFIDEIVLEHKKSLDQNDMRDFTDYILQNEAEMKTTGLQDFQIEITDKHIRQMLLDMFFAGTDTSRITLTWALMYLAAHPEVQKKAQKEIDDNIGREGQITSSSRLRIPFCEAVIYETLRLRTPVPLALPHATTCDTSVGGYEIAKGTTVFVNLLHIHTNPKDWDAPLIFNPDRFLDRDGNLAPKPNAFLPFSTGRRQCVGEAFAKSELHIILGMLLQRFTFSPPEGKVIDCTPKKNIFTFLPLDDQTQLVITER